MGEAARNLRSLALPAGVALALLALWEAGVRVLNVPAVILPPPSRVLAELTGPLLPKLLENALPSGVQILAGFAVASACGIALAMAMAVFEPAAGHAPALHDRPASGAQDRASAAFILWFGIGFSSRFAFATFICFFPVVISTLAGLRETPPDILRMCRAIGATDAQVMLRVRLPFAVPYIFAGLKIAATMAVIGVVIGEFISADKGLGYLILYSSSRSETPAVMAAIVLLCAIGLALYGLVELGEWAVRRAQRGY